MAETTALLIHNAYLDTEKFREIYALLLAAAERRGIALTLCRNDELLFDLGTGRFLSLPEKPRFALFFDKDVLLARRLEALGIPVFNSSRAIELCDNKALSHEALAAAGLPQPRTVPAPFVFSNIGHTDLAFLARAEAYLSYPMVIKECFGSFGEQVYLAHDRAEAEEIIRKISPRPFLMQEFIAESHSRDVRVNLAGGVAVAAVLRRAKDGDFRSNLTLGGRGEAFPLPEQFCILAERAAAVLGLSFGGIDLLFGKDGRPLICEANSNVHFKTTLDICGIDLADYILEDILKKTAGAK